MAKSEKPLVNILMDPELLEELDEFRFTYRFPSRAAAMKYLMATRLEQKPIPTVEDRSKYSTRLSA